MKSEATRGSKPRERRWTLADKINASAVLVALVGVIWTSVETRKSSRDSQRAWVVTENTSFSVEPSESAIQTVSFDVKNVGASLAIGVGVITTLIVASGTAPNFILPQKWQPGDAINSQAKVGLTPVFSGSVIGPQQVQKSGIVANHPNQLILSRTQIDALSKGQDSLYMFARIAYLDVFERQHVTYVCQIWNAKALPNLNHCNGWNSAN